MGRKATAIIASVIAAPFAATAVAVIIAVDSSSASPAPLWPTCHAQIKVFEDGSFSTRGLAILDRYGKPRVWNWDEPNVLPKVGWWPGIDGKPCTITIQGNQ